MDALGLNTSTGEGGRRNKEGEEEKRKEKWARKEGKERRKPKLTGF